MSDNSEQAVSSRAIPAGEEFTGREWLLDRVDAWLAGDQPSLLITGAPGTGKTAVAERISAISDGTAPSNGRARLGEGAIGYAHFCRALDPAVLDPVQFVKSLVRSLARRCEPYARALFQLGDQRIEIGGRVEVGHAEAGARISGVDIENLHIGDLSAALAFERLVRRPLSELEEPLATEFVVLVDALDEALTLAGQDTLVTLASDVLSAGGLPKSLRFLLTSRPDPRVVGRLPRPRLDLRDDAPADVDDVRRYAEKRLASLGQRRSQELASRVARAGKGNFLYARYVVRDLLAHPALPDADHVQLPAGLDEHYRQFLRRELKRSDETWEERYRPLLGLLTVAQGDGLTRDLLTGATKLPGSRVDDALRRLGQYLEGPFPNGPFRIYHESFRDFLADDPDYGVYPDEAERALSDRLIAITPTLPSGQRDWSETSEYARVYLATHAAAAGDLDQLLQDSSYLVAADPDRLMVALPSVTGSGARIARDVYRRAFDALRGSAPAERSSYLELAARQAGADDLAEQFSHVEPSRPWSTRWALWRPQVEHFVARRHLGWVSALAKAECNGQPVVVSAGDDQEVCVWNASDGVLALPPLRGANAPLYALAISSTPGTKVIVAASKDGTLHAWTLDEGGLWWSDPLPIAPDSLYAIAPLAIGETPAVVAAGADGVLRVIDVQTGERVGRAIRAHGAPVTAVAVIELRGAPVIVSASSDCSIRFWDLDGHEVMEPLHHDDAVTALAVPETTGEPLLVSGSRDQSVRCWAMSDAAARSQWAEPRAHRGWIRALCAGSLTGTGVVVSAGADGELRVWDVERGLPLGAPLVGHDGWVSAVVIVPDPGVIVSAGQDGSARVWHFTTEPAVDRADASAAGVAAIAIDARARRALYACGEPPAAVSHLDTETGELVRILPAPGAEVRSLSCGIVDDEAVLVSGADDGVVRVTCTGDSRPKLDLHGHVDFVRAVAVTYAGGIGYVVSASDDGTVRVWQPATGQSGVIGYHDDWVRAVAAAPAGDGSVIASGSDDATVRLWRLNADGSTERIAVLVRETPVRAVALDSVGNELTVASGELSGTVRVACVVAPEVVELHGISDHAGPVAALGIAQLRERRVCVSGGLQDGCVRVQDLEDEGEARIRVGAQIYAIVIDDSSRIVVATSMGLLALADVMLADGSPRSRETPVREPAEADAPCPPRLGRGGRGGWVWRVQEGLEKAGFPPSGIDGDFGLNCEQALKLFQRSSGLLETGSMDVATWAALRPSAD